MSGILRALTLRGRREIHVYVRDPESADGIVAEWRVRRDLWGANHSVQADPLWSFADEGFFRPLTTVQKKQKPTLPTLPLPRPTQQD